MPELTASTLGIEDLDPAALEQRRREIIQQLSAFPAGYDDPDIPIPLLHELAMVTGMLRRRNSGPPKAPRRPSVKAAAPKSVDDIEDLFT